MRGPFPPIRHRKHRKYTKYSRCFLYCLDEKTLSQNCFAPQKVRFLCRTRRKAQEYWLCIPSIFNEVRREKILFAAIASLSCTPFRVAFLGLSAPKRYKTIERLRIRYRPHNSTNPALSARKIHEINDLIGVFTDTRKLDFTYLCWEGNKRIGQFLTDAV